MTKTTAQIDELIAGMETAQAVATNEDLARRICLFMDENKISVVDGITALSTVIGLMIKAYMPEDSREDVIRTVLATIVSFSRD